MANAARIPETAPFSNEQIHALNSVVVASTPQQRTWLSGFLAGIDAAHPLPATAPVAAPQPREPLTILYASESGNAEGLAFEAKKVAVRRGFDARVLDMADADLASLGKARNIVVYAATWGEGDPPQRAGEFYAALMSDAAPSLAGTRFAVLGLGDSSYVDFCETAKRIDARLAELGGTRAADRVDLDLDFADGAKVWTAGTLDALAPKDVPASQTVVHVDFHNPLAAPAATAFTAKSPLDAEITALVNLNGSGSTRETWHVELATSEPGFAYQPGDSIGVTPQNDPELVDAILDVTGAGGDDALRDELLRGYDVTTLSRPLIEAFAKLTGRDDAGKLAAEGDALRAYASDRQIIDFLADHREPLTGPQLKGLLRPLPPRYYSVASSPLAHPGETHLLVGAVRWQSHGRHRNGVASTHLADRRKIGQTLALHVKANRHFKLPDDDAQPILMIGAGTGVAPYRGFVAERAERGATGRSWLVFGERNYTNDFLYQLEWQDHLKSGALSRLDVAFSRDQPEKIYVQHRLWQARADVRRWVDEGARVYVCGDEKGLGRDVDTTLARILAEPHGGEVEAGRAKLAALAKAGRYQRDVY